jgi:hypothetical protein
MKRNNYIAFILCIFTVAALLMTSCKKDDKSEPEQQEQGQGTTETLVSNLPRPSWAAPDTTDMTSSMTAVITVDLRAQYPNLAKDYELNEEDLIAAFAGNTCLGVASPMEDLFFLYVAGPTGKIEANDITLRYWSKQYKNIFVATDAFPFVNDSHLGTVAEPLTPAFVVEK